MKTILVLVRWKRAFAEGWQGAILPQEQRPAICNIPRNDAKALDLIEGLCRHANTIVTPQTSQQFDI